jgi:hypothetical protein
LVTVSGITGYFYSYKREAKHAIEMRSARNVILPVLIAERDRG